MVNPQYIDFLNTFGADIDLTPRPIKIEKPPENQDTAQTKKHITEELCPSVIAGIDDLPFKIKVDK